MPDGNLFSESNKDPFGKGFSLLSCSQIEMEKLYSKYQLHECIKEEFKAAGFVAELQRFEINVSFGLDLMTQIYLHKRATVDVLVGLLMKHFKDAVRPAQACADAILDAAHKDVLDFDTLSESFVCKWGISADVQQKIDQFQYPLPMIEQPQIVRNNRDSGYFTIKGSIILRNNHHEDDVCLDHINRVNQIPLALNADIVAFVQNKWKNLDKPKPNESKEDFLKRKAAFSKYDRTSRDILAALMVQGDRIYLTHKYDKRGRTYSQGYHVNYQGNDWNKACIEFAHAEPLNQE